MKIVFDNEHQKSTFFRTVRKKFGCPNIFGLSEYDEADCGTGSCKECWEAAVEIEVKENVKRFPWWDEIMRRFVKVD